MGVLPASFTLYRGTDVYIPLGQWGNPVAESSRGPRSARYWPTQPGVTLAQAQADLDGVMRRLVEVIPKPIGAWAQRSSRSREVGRRCRAESMDLRARSASCC